MNPTNPTITDPTITDPTITSSRSIMNVAIINPSPSNGGVCATDQPGAEGTGCGRTTTNQTAARDDMPRRKTLSRAGIVGVLCVLGCAAGPLAIGGLAAVTGAISGEAWIIAAGVLIAAVVYAHRRKTSRRGC